MAIAMEEQTMSGNSSPPPPPPLASFNPPAPPVETEEVPPPPPEPFSMGRESIRAPARPQTKQGWSAKPSRQPLSVEEIIRKKKEADEAASKVSEHQPSIAIKCSHFVS